MSEPETNLRVRLIIQNEMLHQSGIDTIEQRVVQVPGVSLADIMATYSLSSRMKVALAYIRSYSVWLYFESTSVTAT